MKITDFLIFILMLLASLGAANWATSQWFDLNLVQVISFGNGQIATTLYGIIGVAGFIGLVSAFIYLKQKY